MKKINRINLPINIQNRLDHFKSGFSVLPNDYSNSGVKTLCDKYRDHTVREDIEQQLENMHQNGIHVCCCYCECIVGGGNRDDIEHVRPKSKFPRESLDRSNMLLACNTCNRSNKNDNYENGFLNVSDNTYDFNSHFQYGLLSNKFIMSGISREGEITLKCLKENKFDNHTLKARWNIFIKLEEKIKKAKMRGKDITEIKSDLSEVVEDLGKNYTFSKRLLEDPDSPLQLLLN